AAMRCDCTGNVADRRLHHTPTLRKSVVRKASTDLLACRDRLQNLRVHRSGSAISFCTVRDSYCFYSLLVWRQALEPRDRFCCRFDSSDLDRLLYIRARGIHGHAPHGVSYRCTDVFSDRKQRIATHAAPVVLRILCRTWCRPSCQGTNRSGVAGIVAGSVIVVPRQLERVEELVSRRAVDYGGCRVTVVHCVYGLQWLDVHQCIFRES